MTRLTPPAGVREIAEALEEAGYETWCVGGAVRDALLGVPHLDWDLATRATPPEVRRVFGNRRTKPVGVEFGTVGVIDRHGVMHEVTTFRRDVETDGRHATVEFGASIDEDLARRDFTVNAIAYSPKTGEVRDPFGGRADLGRKVLRAVGDADARMREDRLRALRAIRFAARFGFEIDAPTRSAIVASAPHLGRLSAERVRQEVEKTLEQVARPSAAFALWRESGLLAALVPPLAAVPDLALAAIDCVPRPRGPRASQRKALRLAALVSDPAVPDVARVLRGLRFSNQEIGWTTTLVERWRLLEPAMRAALTAREPPSDADVRRWVAAAGRTRAASVIRLAAARWDAERTVGETVPSDAAVRGLYRRAVRSAFRDPIELTRLEVDGDDLRAAGIPAGPWLGRILQSLLDRVVNDPSQNARDRLLAEALLEYRRLQPPQRPQ